MTSETIISEQQKSGGRRGRPKKYPGGVDTSTTSKPPMKQPPSQPLPLPPQQASPSTASNTPTPTTPTLFEEKPREERSYKDFFPDLNIKAPLSIVKINNTSTSCPSTSLQEQDQQGENLKSPTSNDEYETASEGEIPPRTTFATATTTIKKSNKLPIATFKKISTLQQKQDIDEDETEAEEEEEEEAEEQVVDDAMEIETNSHLFHRPENHYIRYIEPSETELFETVEYDMDEQDEVWLKIYNNERKKENSGQVSSDLFESIIDQLEKLWFDLVKGLPKKTNDEPALPEDSKCSICDDGECENSNAIVFCDGCNLAVHQDCYGIPYIPEGQWLCRKCMVSPENPVSCIFCPGEGGAFKQTTTNQWGHLLCAIWIPEVGLSNSVYMEPIDNIENVPKSRWKLNCYICKRRHGACIQCDNKHCFVAFHVTCARWARLCMRMKLHGTHYDGVVLKAYCDRHTPRDYKDQIDVEKSVADAQRWFTNSKRKGKKMPRKRYIDEEDLEDLDDEPGLEEEEVTKQSTKKQRRQQAVTQLLPASKAARAHQHQYAAGAPIAPEYILEKLENLKCVRQATNLKKKSLMITSICRYWSLKRESRRGAPLLKRLHLEPWTASASQLKQTEVEKAHKASSMITLRADIEKVRMLSEQVQKRERLKLERIRKQKAYLEMILYPIELIIQPILDQLIELDKKELFRYPVTKDVAPDYHDIITDPMSFQDMIEKLSSHKYLTLDEFEHDLSLIWKNSLTYNKADTPWFKLAQKFEKTMQELMAVARHNYDSLGIAENHGLLDVEVDPEIFSYGDDTIKPLKISKKTGGEKENIPQQEQEQQQEKHDTRSSSSSLSSLSTISSDSTLLQTFVKRRASESFDQATTAPKKRKASTTSTSTSLEEEQEQPSKKPIIRLTRSKTEKEKRSLRSRSITKDMHHPVKKAPSSSTSRKRTISPVIHDSEIPKHAKRRVSTSSSTAAASSSTQDEGGVRTIGRRSTRSHAVQDQVEQPTSSSATTTHDTQPKSPTKIKVLLKPPEEKKKEEKKQEEKKKEEKEKEEKKKEQKKKKKSSAAATTTSTITTGDEVKFEHDEIVWARVRGFPSHPARIVDPKKRKKIPENVLALQDKTGEKILVEFFQVSETHTWGWIEKKEIHAFGDPATDIDMLTQAKRTKKNYRIKEVRKGYKFACQLLKLDPLPQLQSVYKKCI